MDNLNKLLKYLLPNEEINKIVSESGVSKEVVEKACVDIFDKLIPSDFNRQESGHIDRKDLNSISNNFNNLLANDNLKILINEISEKYSIEKANAGVLVKKVLVNVRGKLQYMTAPKKETVKEEVTKEEAKKETTKEEIKEEAFNKKEKIIKESILKEDIHKEETVDDFKMAKTEKIFLYIIGGCLLAVIAVVAFILIKTLL